MDNHIQKFLEAEYPNSRPGFIAILIDALELHEKKNHDYNKDNSEIAISEFETYAKFADVRRKYSRLYNLMVEKKVMKVDEQLEDTIIDLGNYAFLLAEYLKQK